MFLFAYSLIGVFANSSDKLNIPDFISKSGMFCYCVTLAGLAFFSL